ncbi:MAG: TIGR01458 family HAD-type hydrolase [Planctomycetota bacterium]
MPVTSIQAVLIDISGVLAVGGEAVPGSVAALRRLREAGRAVRFLTNTTRKPRSALVGELRAMGFEIETDEVFTAPLAARRVIEQQGWRPHLLVHDAVREDFAGLPTDRPNAVVLGDAADGFTYASLNEAFRVLMGGHESGVEPSGGGGVLVSMGSNRYFRDGDGALSLDMGPFVAALAFAAGVEARVTGKPAAAFFRAALQDMGVRPGAAVMIGDDLPNDIGGAAVCGVAGVLVRTGKFRPADEHDAEVQPEAVCDDFAAAVDWVLGPG